VTLYGGPRADYSVALEVPAQAPPPARKPSGPRAAGKPKGGWYLSLLDGKLEKHAAWQECQARVHGRNAKFKKVSSAEEEAATLRSWGL
jgi:hypothetical protein